MKLVEILAKELEDWPQGCDVAVCDRDGEIRLLNSGCEFDFYPNTQVDESDRINGVAPLGSGGKRVTKEMWEAEKAKMIVQNMPEAESFDPIYCRDRIKETDALVESLEEERVSLVQALEDEGFSLIERINKQLEECKQSHGDMSDPSNWEEGDLIECIDGGSGVYTKGSLYTFIEISEWGSIRCVDDTGRENGALPECFEWHSPH